MLNRLEMLRLFCAAAEARSFKEAAQRLGVAPQAVTRAVQDLEAELGELLFLRNTRQSRITEAGEALAAQAKSGLEGIDAIFRKRRQREAAGIEGLVRIAAPVAPGELYLVPLLARLRAQHPGLRFDVRLSDASSDVIDEQIDVGVHFGFLRDSRYVARAVARVPFYIVGTPALIAQTGVPRNLADLERMPACAALDTRTGKPWPWFLAGGAQWTPRQPAFLANDTRAEFNAVLQGLGFGQIAGYLAVASLRSGALRAVLPGLAPSPWNISIYRPQRGPVAARVRAVFDALAGGFADPKVLPLKP